MFLKQITNVLHKNSIMKRIKNKFGLVFFTLSFVMLISCIQAQDIIDKVDETFNNITTIEVEGSFCNVDIVGGSGSDVKLTGEILASRDYDIKIRHSVNGGTLRVWLERPNSLRNVKGKLELKVPANTNIRVDNSSGSVNVENISKYDVKIKASSGSVKARSIGSGITAIASSGSIYLEDIEGDAQATSSSGSQKIKDIKGTLNAKASSGSIKAENINGEADITTSSGSQSITSVGNNLNSISSSGSLNINNVTGDLKATCSSGRINIDKITGTVNLTSTSGSIQGANIKLTGNSNFKSSSGSISMELLNDADELSFDLSASSGSLKAKGSSGHKKLVVYRGPIKINGVTSSGSQSYR